MTTKEMINEVHALVAAAVKVENDRIVALLESLAYIDDGGQEMITEYKSELIQLVKGGNK
jgi:hypothetical protein